MIIERVIWEYGAEKLKGHGSRETRTMNDKQDKLPSSKVSRAGRFFKTGMKVSGNYLKHYSKKALNKQVDRSDLDKKNADDIFKMLTQLKGELSEDIDRTVHTMQDEATVFADPNDRASQESDISLELRNRDRERKLIRKIDETIAKIDAGEYGYCESCGIEIGLKRLEARPTATLCIDCKTLDEMRERQVAK